MEEMLRRRFARLIRGGGTSPVASERSAGGSRIRRRSSWSTAAGASSAYASKVLADVGLDIPHIGLAKRLEEVYLPGRARTR